MTNERLRGAILAAGLTLDDVADRIGVAPKTVERWVTTSRLPHRVHRAAVAKLLNVDEGYTWPVVVQDPHTQSASRAELVDFYPSRSAVPHELWRQLPDQAVECFDFLAFAGLFMPEQTDAFVPRLVKKAENGVRVRILIGDPDGNAVAVRGSEEDVGDGMAQRARLCLRYFRGTAEVKGLQVRLHNTTLYASIYRADNVALVNTHVYGSTAAQNPVLHLQRVPGGRVFDNYLQSFDTIWASAKSADAFIKSAA